MRVHVYVFMLNSSPCSLPESLESSEWQLLMVEVSQTRNRHDHPQNSSLGAAIGFPGRNSIHGPYQAVFYRRLPIFRTFLGDSNPQKLPSRRLRTLWEWKNRVLLEEYYIFNVAISTDYTLRGGGLVYLVFVQYTVYGDQFLASTRHEVGGLGGL